MIYPACCNGPDDDWDWIVNFSTGGGAHGLYGDFGLGASPPTPLLSTYVRNRTEPCQTGTKPYHPHTHTKNGKSGRKSSRRQRRRLFHRDPKRAETTRLACGPPRLSRTCCAWSAWARAAGAQSSTGAPTSGRVWRPRGRTRYPRSPSTRARGINTWSRRGAGERRGRSTSSVWANSYTEFSVRYE